MGHVRRRNIVRSNPWGWLKRTEGAGGDSSSLVIIPPSLNSSVRSSKSRVKMYSNRCSCQYKGHTKYGHATLCRYLLGAAEKGPAPFVGGVQWAPSPVATTPNPLIWLRRRPHPSKSFGIRRTDLGDFGSSQHL